MHAITTSRDVKEECSRLWTPFNLRNKSRFDSTFSAFHGRREKREGAEKESVEEVRRKEGFKAHRRNVRLKRSTLEIGERDGIMERRRLNVPRGASRGPYSGMGSFIYFN